MSEQYIFGIGMNKTGTSSLCAALCRMGFRCKHAARTIKRVAAENKAAGRLPLYGLTDEYVAFADSPINSMFAELDVAYPGSKFILTVRDMRPWVVSRLSQFGGSPSSHMRKYKNHMTRVRDYFKDRPDDILEYDLCGGERYEPLCEFLGVAVPDKPFPWHNMTGPKRKARIERMLG